MKNFIQIILLGVITIHAAHSQNTIKGVVTDAKTTNGIPFASVYFPQLEKGTETDSNGSFTIENLPDGTYKLVVSSVGFTTFTSNVKTGLTNQLSISLNPSAIEMEEVIVSTPFHKLQSDNVMKVERASISKLKAEGALTLAEGLNNISGVESVSTGVGIGKPVIRGLSGNRVLVYTQGIRLENQQFGDEHGLGINDAGIESVEVIKGPASLLYGSDALGGVLYLNPERFANSNSSEGDINLNYYTNTLGYSTNGGFKTSGDKFKFLIRGTYSSHADYKTGASERVTNTRFNEVDLKSGIGYQSGNFISEIRYNLNKSKLGIPEEVGLQSKDRTPLEPYQEITSHIFSSKSSLFFDNSSLDVILGYTYNDRQEFEEHHHHEEEEVPGEEEHLEEEHGEEAALNMDLNTFNYNIRYNLPKLGNFETIIGVQGMYQTNKNFGEEILIPDATTSDFGLLATSHYHLEKFDFQFGIRYDIRSIDTDAHGEITDEHYIAAIDKNFNSFNASFGTKINFSDHIDLRLNIASGFRAPNLAELTSNGVHHGTNRYEIGNSNLNNERNLQTDFTLEYKNQHFEAFFDGFYNKINDYIFLEPNGETLDDNPVFNYVQEDAKLFGGETGFHLHPHPIDWLHFESSFEIVFGEQNTGEYLPLIPASSLTNTFRVEFDQDKKVVKNSYGFITLKNVFDQNNASQFETPTNSYVLLNLGLGGKISLGRQELNLNLSVNNLLDESYYSHLSRLKRDGIYNIGRNINFGINMPF
ncbi:TonB-dependent receptor [Zhouia amylolytica]|uniref:TonB-dependent Receptor n=1 Tax=Zhouia amylolytica AD3 TaxID=1286632 RepID=W2UPK2_9FLAO|nr:TonB-dependent receptor [Zhouia amylolytica]ETN95411.1 tonB-dependent Receptor [Zhouia amylolytica AD3]